GLSGCSQNQSQWAGADVAATPRSLAAHLQSRAGDGICLAPHRFCRATRQWVIWTPKDKGGYQYAVVLTTVSDLEPATVAETYDGRAMIEATFCQDKQALGLVKRRQHKWEAQQVVRLLARLAHHLLLWSKQWLSRVPSTRWRLQ